MSSAEMNSQPRPAGRRVVVLGVDGGTFDLIRPWAEAGILPTFRRLLQEGAWGSLESTMPPVTPAAWSTMATGMNQGKHGLFDFFGRKPGSYETYLVSAADRRGDSVWRLLSEAGQRVVVFNVPATYPPEPVNGTMVSGLLTPTFATDASYPAGVLKELQDAVPGFSFYPPGIFSQGEEAKFVDDVLNWDRMTLRATEFLMNRQPWDFLFTVFIGVDIVSHMMWRHMVADGAPASPADPDMAKTLANAIQNVYRQVDGILDMMLESAGKDTYVMVVSDHGFGPLDNYIHLNAWLAQKGYLKFKPTPAAQLKYLAFRSGITPLRILDTLRRLRLGGKVQQTASEHNTRLKAMVKQAFLSLDDVDWSRTVAYSAGYGGPIFINTRGKMPHGIVEPGSEYEAVIARLTADLRSVRHPQTGAPLFGDILRPKDIYSGPYLDSAPDLLAVPEDWSNQGYGVHDFASSAWLEPSPDRSGTHRMNGIFLLTGPGVEPGAISGATLQDVAPTVLALMGAPIPTNMDGRVLTPAFSEKLQSELAITYRDAETAAAHEAATADMSADDERAIRERLAALGYLS